MALRAQNPRTERQGGVGAASEDGLGGGGRGAAPLTSPSEGRESRRRPPSGPLRPRPSQAPPGLPQMTRKHRRGTTRAGRPSRARAASNGQLMPRGPRHPLRSQTCSEVRSATPPTVCLPSRVPQASEPTPGLAVLLPILLAPLL